MTVDTKNAIIFAIIYISAQIQQEQKPELGCKAVKIAWISL